MKIHYFQHVPFEGLGCIHEWARQPGKSLTATRFYEDQKLPFVDICDLLIVMGGPMGVYDDQKYPWMKNEKKFIEKAINAGKKVLGICLGAQLIADVLGARVYRNGEKEIGWFPVDFTGEHKMISGFPARSTVFHWHGDTFDLPQGALHLGKSEACRNQMFVYGESVVGIQFHMEMTPADILRIIDNCRNELEPAAFIQKEEKLSAVEHIAGANQLMKSLLDNLANA